MEFIESSNDEQSLIEWLKAHDWVERSETSPASKKGDELDVEG